MLSNRIFSIFDNPPQILIFFIFGCKVFAYRIVQVLRVALVVQKLQDCLFLEHLVNQLIQLVPVAQYYLVLSRRKDVDHNCIKG